MIGRLRGTLVECTPGAVVLDVGGVGYELQIPLSTFYELSRHADGPVSVHVHTRLREDALQLYGFATAEERRAFERFLRVSGVGPKIALAILSGIGVSELESAVAGADLARLQRIPGIGRKTAERLLLELKDRLGPGARKRSRVGDATEPGEAAGGIREDATSALVNLGYTREAAGKAVDKALGKLGAPATLEDTLREALSGLVR